MYGTHGIANLRAALGPLARRTIDRRVIARGRDLKHLAQQRDGERVALFVDPSVFHSDSFAKYAVAFFKISRSISARRSSRWSRRFSARSSSSVACSPQGVGAGASLACHCRKLCSPTFKASAAALNVYFSSVTSRTACSLNSAVNFRRGGLRRTECSCFASLIFRISSGNHYLAPAAIRKSWANAKQVAIGLMT